MANKFFDFLDSILNSSKNSNKTSDADKLIKEYEEWMTAIDKANDSIEKFKRRINELNQQIRDIESRGGDATKAMKELNSFLKRDKENREDLISLNKQYNNFLKEQAKLYQISKHELNDALESGEDLNNVVNKNKTSWKDLAGQLGLTKEALGKTKGLFTSFTLAALESAKQLIVLNEKLIQFQRNMSGTLNARALGFDVYGNNQTGNVGSFSTLANTNNLSEDEFLNTFKAFSEGQILGLTENLQKSQVQLQQYAVTIGRVSKLYGVSNETLADVSKTLSQNFGIKIKDLTTTLYNGAQVAANAGINVQKFFENMKGIANLSGNIFIKNGSEGIEKAAFALTKLGLSVQSLERVGESVKDFSELIEKQNRSAALSLNSYSATVGKIFAKSQTGDLQGALQLQQISLAKDIGSKGFLDKGGQINQQGLQTLKSIGLQQEEIKSIQRLIRTQKELGRSFEDIVDETKLTTVELAKKRRLEQEDAKITEKIKILFAKLESIIIDPLKSILSPLTTILIDGLSVGLSLVQTALKPVTFLFQILGNALTKVAKVFSTAAKTVEEFLNKIGLGNGKGAEAMSKIVDVLGTILGVIIGIGSLLGAWFAFSKIQQGINSLSNFAGGIGKSGFLGKLGGGKLLGGLAKGGAIGTIASIGGGIVGDLVGGKAGSNISSATSGAGLGATIGSIIPGIGTAIGAAIGAVGGLIVENWDDINDWLSKVWRSVTDFLEPIWNVVKFVTPIYWIWQGIKGILEWLDIWDDKQEQKENQVKIASVSATNVSPVEQVSALMKTREVYNTEVIKKQEEKMNKTFQPKIVVNTQNDLFGGYKLKAAGY